MGFRFNLQTANWVAYCLEEGMSVPPTLDDVEAVHALRSFLHQVRTQFYSTGAYEGLVRRRAERSIELLEMFHGDSAQARNIPAAHILSALRDVFVSRPWTALIVPSGRHSEVDRFLCDEHFLRHLVKIRPDDPGLILQLEEPPRSPFSLTDVFPAFRTALAESTRWPGVLLWRQGGDSIFIPISSTSPQKLEHQIHWLFSHLATTMGLDFALLKRQYYHECPSERHARPADCAMVHVSDIHLGSSEASRRLPRVQQLIQNALQEIDIRTPVSFVVTGDLMDSPNQPNADAVRGFLSFLLSLSSQGNQPLVVLGNHDVRQAGILEEDFRHALTLSGSTSGVTWQEDSRCAFVRFDSVRDGKLARGYVGERQFLDLANEIDAKPDWRDYRMIGLLHHHPLPVKKPEWYARGFFERVLGKSFETTVELEDASEFATFVKERAFATVLHGHKHIPRVDVIEDTHIPIVGCGSTVGKVGVEGNGVFMSLNIVTLDSASQTISARLLAERIPGGGLREQQRHEVVYAGRLG